MARSRPFRTLVSLFPDRVLRRRVVGARDLFLLVAMAAIGRTRLQGVLTGRFPGLTVAVRLRGGAALHLRPLSVDPEILREVFEADTYGPREVHGTLRGGTVVDVGAHVGMFSLYAREILGAGRVVALEPNSTNFHLLQRNAEVAGGAIRVANRAVGGRPGRATLALDGANSGGHTLFPTLPGGATEEVEVTTLPSVFDEHGIATCDLLKMDCEGAESEILRACGRDILSRIRFLIFEYHLWRYDRDHLTTLVEILRESGFEVRVRADGTSQGIVYATRSSPGTQGVAIP